MALRRRLCKSAAQTLEMNIMKTKQLLIAALLASSALAMNPAMAHGSAALT